MTTSEIIDLVAKVFAESKDAPTSFEDETWIEGFQDGRAIVAERMALRFKSIPGFDELKFINACKVYSRRMTRADINEVLAPKENNQ